MTHITVELTSEELGLLRAGLAAHAIAINDDPPRSPNAPTFTTVEDWIKRFRSGQSFQQQNDAVQHQIQTCRELSIRLGDAQIEADR